MLVLLATFGGVGRGSHVRSRSGRGVGCRPAPGVPCCFCGRSVVSSRYRRAEGFVCRAQAVDSALLVWLGQSFRT